MTAGSASAYEPLAQRPATKRSVRPGFGSVERFDERSLVESARTDANAFAELYRRYVERIYTYCYRRSGSAAVAEDVTSATFEKALKGLPRYKWREPGIGPWLFRIASNEFVNHLRSTSKHDRAARSVTHQRGREIHSDMEAAMADNSELRQALAAIHPRYQRALSLRYFADLTNDEAAAAMGVSRATMAVIVHRGMTALRKAVVSVRAIDEPVEVEGALGDA